MTGATDGTNGTGERLVYCHCAYAKVVPEGVKLEVLRALGASGRDFEALPDLCEMSARKDPALRRFAGDGRTRIAACYPRAVEWLFHAGGAPLGEDHGVEVVNMRELAAEDVMSRLLAANEVEEQEA
jgi:hypothetical protein